VKVRRSARWIVAGIGLAVVAALAHTWVRLRALDLGYAIAAETKRLEDLKQTERRLRVEVSYLKRPARIEGEARRLGLRAPDPGEIRRVRVVAGADRKTP
jgi:cell division protein FtsB